MLVGPKNIPNHETREVRVLGDKSLPIKVEIDPKTSWYKQYLLDAKKHLSTVGPTISTIKKKHKSLRNRPLVEQN